MRLSKFCKEQGMDINEYREYKKELETMSMDIFEKIKKIHYVGTGIYYPVSEIIKDSQEKPYIIENLKAMGVEFIRNHEFYRF